MTLEVRNLSVRFGERELLLNVDLGVGVGETISIMGPSGSGKSTLLRAIAGLQPITAGIVFVGELDVTNLPTHRRNVGMVFQDLALFPHLNVGDNIAYGLRMQGVSKSERTRRCDELLELVRLSGSAKRNVGTLSGGEQQRVALARALAPKPEILLLDEPFASLDRDLSATLVREVGAILNSQGTSVLHVTHDATEPEAIGAAKVLRVQPNGSLA